MTNEPIWLQTLTEFTYPQYEKYVHEVLKARLVEPNLQEVIRWYKFLDWLIYAQGIDRIGANSPLVGVGDINEGKGVG